jgi:hypothetical protein
MKPSPKLNLQNLSLLDRYLILFYVLRLHLRTRLHSLRPGHLLIPAAVSQMVLFAWVILHPVEPVLYNLAIGNLLIIAVAILPSMAKFKIKN